MPGRKKPTLQDIAKELNITPSAVSKALNNHPRISEKTKAAVLKVARRLNYQPNHLASALRSGRSYLLGVIVPAIDYAFFSSVVRGIEEVATQSGYNVIIAQSNDSFTKEQASVDALIRTQVDGVLVSIANSTTHFDHFHKLIDNGIPLILFDRVGEDLPVSTVVIDDYQGAARAVQHLIDQGCRRIAHLAGYNRISLYRHRSKAYRDTLEQNGLLFRPEWMIESDLTLADGERIVQQMLRQKEIPDAIFAAGDHAALGAMHVLQQAKIRIPEEVSVVGFSNEPFSAFIRPGLSTVDQQTIEMGRIAAELFLKQIQSKEQSAGISQKVLSPQLIVRDSSRRLI